MKRPRCSACRAENSLVSQKEHGPIVIGSTALSGQRPNVGSEDLPQAYPDPEIRVLLNDQVIVVNESVIQGGKVWEHSGRNDQRHQLPCAPAVVWRSGLLY